MNFSFVYIIVSSWINKLLIEVHFYLLINLYGWLARVVRKYPRIKVYVLDSFEDQRYQSRQLRNCGGLFIYFAIIYIVQKVDTISIKFDKLGAQKIPTMLNSHGYIVIEHVHYKKTICRYIQIHVVQSCTIIHWTPKLGFLIQRIQESAHYRHHV